MSAVGPPCRLTIAVLDINVCDALSTLTVKCALQRRHYNSIYHSNEYNFNNDDDNGDDCDTLQYYCRLCSFIICTVTPATLLSK